MYRRVGGGVVTLGKERAKKKIEELWGGKKGKNIRKEGEKTNVNTIETRNPPRGRNDPGGAETGGDGVQALSCSAGIVLFGVLGGWHSWGGIDSRRII